MYTRPVIVVRCNQSNSMVTAKLSECDRVIYYKPFMVRLEEGNCKTTSSWQSKFKGPLVYYLVSLWCNVHEHV